MYAYCENNPITRADSKGIFFFTAIGALVGGIIGGISAAIRGEDVIAGAAGGAVTGAIMGALTDATVATGGAALGAAIAVGAVAGAAGDITTQVVHNMRQGATFGQAFENLDGLSIAVSAFSGALAGGLSNLAGRTLKHLIFDPAKDVFVENAISYATGESMIYSSSSALVNTATQTGIAEMTTETLISIGQTALYNKLATSFRVLMEQ